MKRLFFPTLILIVLAGACLAQDSPKAATTAAQTTASIQVAPGTIISAELSKSLSAKKLKVGDKVEAKTTVDLLSHGQIVIPRNSKILGHITAVKAHSKESPDSMVGIAFDQLLLKGGHELPLKAEVQAVGRPLNAFATSEHSPMGASSPPVGDVSGGSVYPPMQSTGAATASATASAPQQPPQPYPTRASGSSEDTAPVGARVSPLGPTSQGAVGMKGLSLSTSAQASVISSKTENVHLDGATQLILRTQ